MSELRQSIHFTTGVDGVRLAYATVGKGPPLVRAPTWTGHLEADWQSPFARHWLTELCRHHTLVRYDQRGGGMSDWDIAGMSFEIWLSDLESVVDALGLTRFPLFGMSHGVTMAIAYAVRHPERVSHLILYGGFCRGRMKRNPTQEQIERAHTMIKLAELGWGTDHAGFRQVFSSLFLPGGTAEQWRWMCDKMRHAMSPQNAVRFLQTLQEVDVCDLARQVSCPTLVMHACHDAMIPYEEGKLTAALIPNAEFVTLDSANHVMLEDEPAWRQFVAELRRFLPVAPALDCAAKGFVDLTKRERDVLELIAAGLSNDQIAEQLFLSPKTIGNHITSIFAKIDVANRAQAIVQARDAGFGSGVLSRST